MDNNNDLQPANNPSEPSSEQTPNLTTVEPTVQTQPTVTPPVQVPPAVAVPAKPKKHHTVLLYVLVGFLLIALGVGGGWLLFGRNTAQTTQSQTKTTTSTAAKSTTTQQTTETILKPADIIAKIKTEAAKSATLVDSTTVTQLKSGQVSYSTGTYSPAYKPAGYNFYISASTDGANISFTSYFGSGMTLPTPTETALRTTIIQLYKDFGLTKTATYGSTEANSLSDVYTGKGVICTVDATTAQVSPTSANCGLISAYAAAAAKAKPVIETLPDLTSSTSIGSVKIKDSQTDGYQTAQTSVGNVEGVGGYVALFYKKDGGTWKYFKGTQEIIPCSDYNTTDIRNAFMGDACWDNATNKESTVQ